MKADRTIGIFLILFSAFMYSQTLDFPEAVFGTMGAGFFPRILFGLLAIAGAGLTLKTFVREEGKTAGREEARTSAVLRDHSAVIISFLIVAAYILCMSFAGYSVSTLLFMFFLMWYLAPPEKRRLPLMIVLSFALTFTIYISFEKILQVFLPEGILF